MFYKFYFIDKFKKNNIDLLDKNTRIIYRNYKKKINIEDIILLRDYCRKKGLRFFLSNNIKLSIRLDLDGAYIPSFNTNTNHLSYNLKQKFELIGSAHNLKEIRIKELQKVDAIFLSSIFKENINYLGLLKFLNLSSLSKTKIIALGGISKKNKKILKLLNSWGFAGISYFK